MEKYTMFMDRKNQYSENEYTTQSNLEIQCNPYQATNGIFHRARTNNFTICMEIQKNLKYPKLSWERRMELEESNCLTSDSPSPIPLLFSNHLFVLCVSDTCCFVTFIHLFCFIAFTCKWNHMTFVFLCLIHFTLHSQGPSMIL